MRYNENVDGFCRQNYKTMEIKAMLQQFGLEGKKADVYLALLELGSAKVTEIAKKAEIKRTTCYDVLQDLEKNGLVYKTAQGKKTIFVAEDPKKLEKKIQEKERLLNEFLPELRSIYNVKGVKPKIRFYEGKEGLREVYMDTLNYKGEFLAFASEDVVSVLGHDWVENYLRARVKKNIHVRAIMPKTSLIKEKYFARDREQLRISKLINPDKYPFSIEINIYGHQKVAFMSSKERIGLIVEGLEIHKTMRSIFELLWDHLPERNSQ